MSRLQLGYARVSTAPQSLDQQLDALRARGINDQYIFTDKMSGAQKDRPGLNALMAHARSGDTVVVTALDRLGRSLIHVIETIKSLEDRDIVLVSLRENIDFASPTGKMMAAVFAALAEYERTLIRERSAAAREAARARGLATGRPRALNDQQVDLARRMHFAGESIKTIADVLSVSRATVYRAVDGSTASVAVRADGWNV